jgi:hypothetical protein
LLTVSGERWDEDIPSGYPASVPSKWLGFDWTDDQSCKPGLLACNMAADPLPRFGAGFSGLQILTWVDVAAIPDTE